MINGIIFQKNTNGKYKGVEGNNWYLNYYKTFEQYYDENIDKSWENDDFVDVTNDDKFIEEYIRLSKENKINFRMILCETPQNYPEYKYAGKYEKKFLGYDYAYAGGSYYSAVLNDMCLREFNEFRNLVLNENGLFEKYSDLIQFINIRNKLYVEKNNLFECGEFIVYRLYEILV
ncbi:MAG: hypothetical protein K6F39_03720 [Lachnospiraceae bacterium]|nr:hypothetical protein [Lachnospiraceae bacterium]